MSFHKVASGNYVSMCSSRSEDNSKEVMPNKKTLDDNIDNAEDKKMNLATLQPLTPLDKRNTAEIVNDLVNYRYRDTFAELLAKMRKQRLALAEAQLKKTADSNIKKCSFGVQLQCLRHIDDDSSDDTPNNDSFISFKSNANDETKKENSSLQEAKSTEEAQNSEKYSLDLNLLCVKLQALEQSYENKAKNWQEGYDGSFSSETENSKEEAIRNVKVYSGETQKSLVDNDNEANHVTVNGNIKFMEAQKHGNVIIRTNVPKSDKDTSTEQNGNAILKAAFEPLNHSKVNLFSPEYNEACTPIGYELTRGDAYQKSYSISTDQLNYLLSIAYCQNNQTANSGATLSSNTSITSRFNSYGPSPNFTQNVRYSYPSYEEVSGFGFDPNTYEGQKNMRKHLNINEQIVKQVIKMLVFGCQNRPQFLGSYIHLDGEKILLVAKTRRNALREHFYKATEPLARETSATIVLEKFGLQLNLSNIELFSPNVEQYYMCIVEHKTTVYSTDIKVANEYGCISFGDRFIFENVTNTFDIKVSLYSLTLKVSTGKCASWLERRPQVPMMTLIGVAHIGLLNAKCRQFPFKNAGNITRPEHTLLTTVGVTFHWPRTVKGFLTMGFSQSNRQPTWNKRWTILEDGQLKYFNFPSDELFCPPIGIVDVRECASIESSPFDYMMKKTLILILNTNQNSFVKLHICADTRQEQLMWFEKFKAVMKLKNDWRELKK